MPTHRATAICTSCSGLYESCSQGIGVYIVAFADVVTDSLEEEGEGELKG